MLFALPSQLYPTQHFAGTGLFQHALSLKMKTYFVRLSILPTIYLLIVAASLVFMAVMARQTAFCGIYAIIVTLPWSVLFTLILTTINPEFFDHSMVPGTAIIIVSAFLNAVLIYFATRLLHPKA